MSFDFNEDNLQKFYNDNYLKHLGEKWKISIDAYNHLYPFQIRGIQFLFKNFLKNQSCILDYDPGMGKTVIICVLFDTILSTKTQFQTLIICEHDLINHWYEHFINWSSFDPICIRKSTDCKNLQLADKSMIFIVNFEILSEIKTNKWNLIIIDNADKKSIINNRHLKKFQDNSKSSMFILLTNAAIRKPSKRETLWYILHFLKPEPPVPSLKKFTSESLCTLQDKVWFPWRHLYQRIGWYIYPMYKDAIQKDHPVIVKRQINTLENQIVNDTNSTIDLHNTTINVDKYDLTQYINITKKLPENDFIIINNDYVTPRCMKIRRILETNTATKSNDNKNASCTLNLDNNKLQTISDNIINESTNLNNGDTLKNNKAITDTSDKKQNNSTSNYETKWDDIFDRLISSKNVNKSTTNTLKTGNEITVEEVIIKEDTQKFDSIPNIVNHTDNKKSDNTPVNKEKHLNSLFDKLIPDDKIIDERDRKAFTFTDNKMIENIKTLDNKSVDKRKQIDVLFDKLISGDNIDERKKLKLDDNNDDREQSTHLEQLATNVENFKPKKSNNFESMFDRLISKK